MQWTAKEIVIMAEKSWSEFECLYPTEESCWVPIMDAADSTDSLSCRKCNSSEFVYHSNMRFMRCKNCHAENSRTAGTFFERVKKPRAWLGAIWFCSQGLMVSASLLAKLAKVAYSTAWVIQQRIGSILTEDMKNEALENLVASQFEKIISKRSNATPAFEHPIAELIDPTHSTASEKKGENIPGTKPDDVDKVSSILADETDPERNSANEPDSFSFEERMIYDLIAQQPCSFERLCNITGMSVSAVSATVTILELNGLVTLNPNGLLVLDDRERLKKEHGQSNKSSNHARLIQSFIDLVKPALHGVSVKHLQSYLARFWHLSVPRQISFDELLQLCKRFHHVAEYDIFSRAHGKLTVAVGASLIDYYNEQQQPAVPY